MKIKTRPPMNRDPPLREAEACTDRHALRERPAPAASLSSPAAGRAPACARPDTDGATPPPDPTPPPHFIPSNWAAVLSPAVLFRWARIGMWQRCPCAANNPPRHPAIDATTRANVREFLTATHPWRHIRGKFNPV